jgi:hypothetical protein
MRHPSVQPIERSVLPMRKIVPFALTAIVSVAFTATIVQASSGGAAPLRAVPVAPSRILGVDLTIRTCNSSPDNATKWRAFAKCATGNFARIRAWASKLDNCMQVFQVSERNDDVYAGPGGVTGPNPELQTGSGLVYGGNATNPRWVMGWKSSATTCPRS